jgi:hypothetical protein
LLLGWAALAGSLLLLSLAGLAGMADLVRRARPLPADDRRRQLASELATEIGLTAAPRIGELDALHSPLALPGGRILPRPPRCAANRNSSAHGLPRPRTSAVTSSPAAHWSA